MSPPTRPRDCPCHSGHRYAACCKPLHDGRTEAETPEALMRSRYAAFALGLGGYLVDTLAVTHADRQGPRAELERALGAARFSQRFMGLRILDGQSDETRGEVLFHARIFVGGRDRSFYELSRFVREDGRWRYAEGELLMAGQVPEGETALGCASFRELVRAQAQAPADPTGETHP